MWKKNAGKYGVPNCKTTLRSPRFVFKTNTESGRSGSPERVNRPPTGAFSRLRVCDFSLASPIVTSRGSVVQLVRWSCEVQNTIWFSWKLSHHLIGMLRKFKILLTGRYSHLAVRMRKNEQMSWFITRNGKGKQKNLSKHNNVLCSALRPVTSRPRETREIIIKQWWEGAGDGY